MGVAQLECGDSTPSLALLRVPGQKFDGLQGGGDIWANGFFGIIEGQYWVVCWQCHIPDTHRIENYAA